jgi:uncharacterized phage-associated protein
MAYNPIAVANAFIEVSNREGCKDLTLLKLMKLVYFAHAWHLVATDGQPLIDEEFEALKFGTVSRDIYDTFKKYRLQPITNQEYPELVDLETLESFYPELPRGDKNFDELIKTIWDLYGKLAATDLSDLTHLPGDPWHIVWEKQEGKNIRGAGIPNHLIHECYKKMTSKVPNPSAVF